MTVKRSLYVSITIFVTADVETDGASSTITLRNVKDNVVGAVHVHDGAPETTQEWREAIAGVAAKHGMQHIIDSMEGKHDGPTPVTSQPGADA